MRLTRMATVAMLTVAASFAITSPAQAGGWATTLLDPVPDQLQPARAYTVGYWVLQHGSHPYKGDLGQTGLRLTDEAGKSTTYPGTPLAEPGHYATAVVFPHIGTWRLSSLQGIFADYEIGTVTLPGAIRAVPTPTPMTLDDGDAGHWGAIQPPLAGLPGPTSTDPGGRMPAATLTSTATPGRGSATAPSTGQPLRSAAVAGAALTAAGLALLLGRRRSRAPRRQAAPPPPV